MKRVVCIAYYYPPLAGIASERAAAFSLHLSQLGWAPIIVTPRDGFYHRVASFNDPIADVRRTRSIELGRIVRAGSTLVGAPRPPSDSLTVRPLQTNAASAKARRWVREWLYVPDAQVGWIPFATRAAMTALREVEGPRVVFSSSVPYSAHLVAGRAAKRAGVPWVAEFRDPWTDGRSPNRTRSRARRHIDHCVEQRILLGADHIVVPTESMRGLLLARVTELAHDNVSVVRNGFEPTEAGSPPPSDDVMTILYAGTVAPGEDVGPLLAALDAVDRRDPSRFRLHVLGPSQPWEAGARRLPWLRLDGLVSPQEARLRMAGSSVLLLLHQHPAYWLAVPGKAYEYLGVRRPILAVIPRGSEMESVISRHGDARVVDLDDPVELSAAMEALLADHRAGRLQAPRVETSVAAPLRRLEQAKQLAAIFERVSEARLQH